jgi:hypothetical protein
MTYDQAGDLRAQRERFDKDRKMIEQEFPGRVVGFVADELVSNDRTDLLIYEVIERYGGARQLYFERVSVVVSAL